MAANEIHVGDIGLVFEITLLDQNSQPIDLSQASIKEFHFRKPNGTLVVFNASYITDGTDGGLTYTFGDGDLDTSGNWKYQVYFGFGPKRTWSDIGKFRVYPNLT